MNLTDLVKQPESKILEFKRDLSSLAPILKTIIAFANTAGGQLIIGCDDNGTIRGVDDPFKAEERIANAIADNISPPMLPEIELGSVNRKTLIIIKVAYWHGPFYMRKLGMPQGVYVRLGSTSRPASPDLLAEMSRSAVYTSYDQQSVSNLSAQDLDYAYIKAQFEKAGKSIEEQELLTLGILNRGANTTHPSIGGLILFGKERVRQSLLPDARVSCARFNGTDKSRIIDSAELKGPLTEAAVLVPKFIERNTRLKTDISGVRRKDIPEYEPIAIREALVNALAHADYSTVGSHVQIAIFDDRLEITSPGMLPFGFTLDDLKSGVSRVRNRVIARTLRELGFMEEWGSGYQRIISSCQKGNYPFPLWAELSSAVRVTFYPHTKGQPSDELTDRQKAILNLFSDDITLSFKEINKQLNLPLSERTLRYDLTKLRRAERLTLTGKGPAARYRLTD